MKIEIDNTNINLIPFKFNNNHFGDAVLDVDGFYYFVFKDKGGYWSEYSLKLISEKLTELNKGWNDYIKENYKNDNKN